MKTPTTWIFCPWLVYQLVQFVMSFNKNIFFQNVQSKTIQEMWLHSFFTKRCSFILREALSNILALGGFGILYMGTSLVFPNLLYLKQNQPLGLTYQFTGWLKAYNTGILFFRRPREYSLRNTAYNS